MADIHREIGTLQMRLDRLETWAGPGQAEASATGIRVIRGDLAVVRSELAAVRRVQDQHTAALTGLHTDVTLLKTDMAEVKTALSEILQRLPPAPPRRALTPRPSVNWR